MSKGKQQNLKKDVHTQVWDAQQLCSFGKVSALCTSITDKKVGQEQQLAQQQLSFLSYEWMEEVPNVCHMKHMGLAKGDKENKQL